MLKDDRKAAILSDKCPCELPAACYYPGIDGVGFPIAVTGSMEPIVPSTAGFLNTAWEYVSDGSNASYSMDYFYDPCTGLWQPLPYISCPKKNDEGMVIVPGPTCSKYWGFGPFINDPYCDFYWAVTGAVNVSNCGISSDSEYEKPHWFLYPTFSFKRRANTYYFGFSDLPEGMPNVEDYALKPNHVYTWKTYSDINKTELVCEGKIKFEFDAYEVSFTDFDMPDYTYRFYPLVKSESGGDVEVKVTVYDINENSKTSYARSLNVPATTTLPCIENLIYAVIGKCSFTGLDCTGCLYGTDLRVVPKSSLKSMIGCHNVAGGKAMGTVKSYKFTLIQNGFEGQAAATLYLNENRETLSTQLKSGCKQGSWVLVGKCNCKDDMNCDSCYYDSESISVKCSDDVEECYEEDGVYYKSVIFESFDTFREAGDYKDEHLDELIVQLKAACPKYYGVHINSISADYPLIISGCLRGFPIVDIWEQSTIEYYRENPQDFVDMYGQYASYSIVTGPYGSYNAVSALLKLFRISWISYCGYECTGDRGRSAHTCAYYFVNPGGPVCGSCPGGNDPFSWVGACRNYGSRTTTSVTEDDACTTDYD